MASDPYAVLGVTRGAARAEVRAAYRAAVLRCHPDKAGGRGEEFRGVVEAYRQICGAEAVETGDGGVAEWDEDYKRRFAEGFAGECRRGGLEVGADELFERLFGGGRDKFSWAAGDDEDEDEDEGPAEREVRLELRLEELFQGCVKKRRVRGGSDEAAVLAVVVQPGYRPGDKVRFRGAGDNGADIVFVIAQAPHDRFDVDGDDLVLPVRVALVDALAGAAVKIESLDARIVTARISDVITPGSTHTVRGEGMPRRGKPGERGDLRIVFEVQFPARVPSEDRAALRDVFTRMEARKQAPGRAIRRSSSLFLNRGGGGAQEHRRTSSVGRDTGREPDARDAGGKDGSRVASPGAARPPLPSAQKAHRPKMKAFTALFR